MYTPTLALINWDAIRSELSGALSVLALVVLGLVIWAAVTGNMKKVVMSIGGVIGAGLVFASIMLLLDPERTKTLFSGFFQ